MDSYQFNQLLQKLPADPAALEPIYAEYYPKLKRHLGCRFHGCIPCDDVLQDTFLALLSAPPQHVQFPDAFLQHLAVNKAVDFLRRSRKEVPLSPILYSLDGDFDGSFDGGLGGAAERLDLERELNAMDPDSREIVYLHFVEGYSLKEISDIKKIGYEAVRKRTTRACLKLRKLFRH